MGGGGGCMVDFTLLTATLSIPNAFLLLLLYSHFISALRLIFQLYILFIIHLLNWTNVIRGFVYAMGNIEIEQSDFHCTVLATESNWTSNNYIV